ncbi:MAG: hydroxyacid dehydrogenase [Thermoprotei archaeon]|nr:MAG: hydroxyacid dehydrogenase [Thermoprotei archaeon]
MFKLTIASGTFGKYAPEVMETLSKYFTEIKRVRLSNDMSDEEIAARLENADVVIIGGLGRISKGVIERTPALKLIAKHGIGVDNIDLDTATRRGIPVIYCRHTMEERSVAEHTIALILSAIRWIPKGDRLVKQNKWTERSSLIGIELYRKTLGIIGLGAIGKMVAKIASKGFDMHVIAYDPYVPDEVFQELGIKKVDLETLLKTSDIITLHIPLTEETRGLLSREKLSLVKNGVVIVNTSRGAVVDEMALAEKIKEGRIKFAALDVMIHEPPKPDNPLLKLENVVITPHIAAYTFEALKRMDTALTEDIVSFLEGKKPKRVANPEVFEVKA